MTFFAVSIVLNTMLSYQASVSGMEYGKYFGYMLVFIDKSVIFLHFVVSYFILFILLPLYTEYIRKLNVRNTIGA